MVSRPKTKRPSKVVVVDASIPVADSVFDVQAFKTFLEQRIKVNGKAGNLGESVSVESTPSQVSVTAKPGTKLPKRYVKYLTKKFLKKDNTRDIFRVIASDKKTYSIKYLNIGQDDEEEQSE
ncbi:60S large subunit ribosomal protein eL22 (rpL22) [Andalucia godoyi]|uniref:Large ribosomal subunit protein eL22 n=1 Tax=Andalucia godoyi TaxID=505711 RepID=A0A8K0AGD2_ANDGO|nr:60S large subunit ribosomal protein eL22 (rpL22) [Andalucia godoyi]|eukprot:ANDGO_05883.mRNA.1 60S large subunit ribosomal protein eL22 (rpL22)